MDLLLPAWKELVSLFNRKRISPVIGKIFPFEKVVDAHTYLQDRQSIGKVLLKVG
jgi:NADPH:quinone reductase-like Zn-dependent oxidoreductase